MNVALFLNMLLGHLIGDFVLQTDELCKKKREKGLCSWFMWVHSLIVAGLIWLAFGDLNFFWGGVITFLSHLLIDAVKSWLERKGQHVGYFVADQVLHMLIIGLVCWMYGDGWRQFDWVPEEFVLLGPAIACAVLLCVKPANILIKGVFEWYQIEIPASAKKNGNDLKNAGALIGSVERLIILVLMLLGQYEAVGFVVAAKSLMRFKDSEGAKAEYVLVGTLLSLCVAMICAMGVMAIR